VTHVDSLISLPQHLSEMLWFGPAADGDIWWHLLTVCNH